MEKVSYNIGFAITGSFCTINNIFSPMKEIAEKGFNVIPIMSEIVYNTDTRFGTASEFVEKCENICNNKVLHSIKETEPIGPKKLLDALIVAPCTGNTISKIANGINDSCVTMAVKAHLRNERPVVLAVSTNDGLGANAKSIGSLLNAKNIYFVPFCQDDAIKKPNSLVARFELIFDTLQNALSCMQIQPVLYV